MNVDLEKFPSSEAAKRMLSYVTKGWYDKSYVGKWVYEVMGREIDSAVDFFEELPLQYFVNTATWGLKYHEMKYGLPIREDLSYEERRKIIREKKDTKAPMTPWRMEQILKGATDYEVHVYDINDGHYFEHPNLFSVQLQGESVLNLGEVKKRVDKLKQSHTLYDFSVILMTIANTEIFDTKVTYRMALLWWMNVLDGSYLLDGSTILDHWYATRFRPVYPLVIQIEEEFSEKMKYRLSNIINDNRVKTTVVLRNTFPWWNGCLDGSSCLDGNQCLDSWFPIKFKSICKVSVLPTEAFSYVTVNSMPQVINAEEIEFKNTQRISFNWREGNAILDGKTHLDGKEKLNNGQPPYVKEILFKMPVEHEEQMGVAMVIPSKKAYLDGSRKLDGTIEMNFGREVL